MMVMIMVLIIIMMGHDDDSNPNIVIALLFLYHKLINIIVSILTIAIIKLILITIFYPHIAKEICPPHISPTSDGFRKDGDVVLLREKLKEGALP